MPAKQVAIDELEAILLSELRKVAGCEGALQVTTIARSSGDWIVGPIRAGTADLGKCKATLAGIEKRFRDMYSLKEKFR